MDKIDPYGITGENLMSDTIFYFQGPVMFAKVFEGNRDKGKYAPDGGQYTIDVGLKDKKDIKLVKSWNKRYKAKSYPDKFSDAVDPDAEYFQFKRKHVHKIDDFGGPPKVVDLYGEPWDGGLIGNGSICTVKLAVYHGNFTDEKGKSWPYTSVRLEGVRVDEYVAFETKSDDDDDEEDTVDDEIPF